MTSNRRLILLLLALALADAARDPFLSGQTSSDSLAVAKAIVEGVVHEARSGGDRFALIELDSSGWAPAVTALLRSKYSDLLVSSSRYALKMAVGEVTVFGDSALATVIWARCTDDPGRFLNYWRHNVVYHLQRSRGAWHFIRRQRVESADGRC